MNTFEKLELQGNFDLTFSRNPVLQLLGNCIYIVLDFSKVFP